ncbi:MAG: FAD:protein FMN transferase [Rikenellaceae bacterium]
MRLLFTARAFSALLAIMAFVGCSDRQPTYTNCNGFAQGTTYSITYCDEQGRDFSSAFDSLLLCFDYSLSNHNDSSLLSRLNRGESSLKLDGWFVECMELAARVYGECDSLLDPTLRPLISAYGFGSAGRSGYHELSDSERDSLLSLVGFHRVGVCGDTLYREDRRISLDFSSIAQGQSVDVLSGWLVERGVSNFLVEVGGEIYAQGVNPKGRTWRVGVDKPTEGNIVPGADLETVIELSGRGLATSGNYRKYFADSLGEKMTHTIDPRTGLMARHNLLSVTILAPNAALADGYATACMVGGLEWAREFVGSRSDVSAFVVYSSGSGEMVSEHL